MRLPCRGAVAQAIERESTASVDLSRNDGVTFGLGSFDAEGDILHLEAYRMGKLVGDDEFPLSALGPVWFDARYRHIDRLVLVTRHSWQFVMDDLRVGAIPDPEGPGPSRPPQ